MTLPEASRYGDIKHTQLFLKLQKVFLHEGENLPGNSPLIIHGNENHQQDMGGKKALHLSSVSPRSCICSDGWDQKLASPQTQIRAFVFPQPPKRPVNL